VLKSIVVGHLCITSSIGGPCDVTCELGKTATGFYGWIGAKIDQASVMCNTLCVACSTCSPGKYIQTACTTSSDAVCQNCPAGKFSLAANTQICTSCTVGTCSSSTGAERSSVCTPCSAGTYSLLGAAV
jgi:hypothetical protein